MKGRWHIIKIDRNELGKPIRPHWQLWNDRGYAGRIEGGKNAQKIVDLLIESEEKEPE